MSTQQRTLHSRGANPSRRVDVGQTAGTSSSHQGAPVVAPDTRAATIRARPDQADRPSARKRETTDPYLLAEALGAAARSFQAENRPDAMLDQLIVAAVRLVPGAQDASFAVFVRRKHVESQHQTSELTQQVDAFQTKTGEGPCLDAIHGQHVVRALDMGHEQRWPNFAERASQLGVGSVLSLQLHVRGDTLGALNLYNRQADAFDDESEQIGLLLASHAAVALAQARKLDHLTTAIASRDLIGQAKGMLMQRYTIDQEQAFRVLMRISQTSHRKLHDIAHELVHTGRLVGLEESQPSSPRRSTSDN